MTSETDRLNNPLPSAVPAISLARYVVCEINDRLKPPLTPDFCECLAEHLSSGAIHPRIVDELMDSIFDEVESARESHVLEYKEDLAMDAQTEMAGDYGHPD